jgi:type II secretory pathway predicted ATPase ExeA
VEHLHHFNLNQDPFQNEPDLRFYVDSAFHRDCQLRMERGLRQCKGLCVLTGEGGTGKTLLARRILDSLEEEMFDANLMVMLAGAADAASVLKRFARQVGVDDPSDDRSGLLTQLYEQLAIIREDGRHCVLILDDAHILSPDALAEVCGLLNLEYEDRRLLSLLLVGVPELDVALSHDPSLTARVDVRVHLSPLDLPNSQAYLSNRLAVVGGSAELFSESAIGSLYKFGRGRPRLLNTLADNALFEAYLEGKKQVESDHVERAAADLGIGADPGSTYSKIPSGQHPTGTPVLGMPSGADAATVVAGFDDPNEDSALELSTVAAPGDGDVDLSSLLEDGPNAEVDLTALTVDSEAEAEAGAMRDLDADMDAALADAGLASGELPAFAASNSRAPASADVTRIALDSEMPRGDEDEIEDLFVELIEE